MRSRLACMLAVLACLLAGFLHAEAAPFVDGVRFIQYLDEGTALEEVRNGNLDVYYSRIPSERIEGADAREGLHVFDSTGGSYSILVNPAPSEKLNPFSSQKARFALNYIMDRKLIVNELMGGYGNVMTSNYGRFDPDYLGILGQAESFHFEYNPALAGQLLAESLTAAGATKSGGIWHAGGESVQVSIFIRSDDPVRKSIGEILASELEGLGLVVNRDYGDLNKAFVVVYGSDPADLEWSLYTEGWGGRSAFVKYDQLGLAQMYSPWFSSMPGFNNPSYWNYENDHLDSLTQDIYAGNFDSADGRTALIQEATIEGVNESVRIFLAAKIDQYVANHGVEGIVNDFGAGVPSRFTPINSRTGSDELVVGVKQIYQGAWNPVMGLGDSYSTHIWGTLYDPGVFKHPHTGENIAIRTGWDVDTAGPGAKLDVPPGAILWNPDTQEWEAVPEGAQATSKVTFELNLGNWHHGQMMDMNDILYSLYFVLEWGSESGEGDRTFDAEYTPRTAQVAGTLVGVVPVDSDTIEVYVDYWHFDRSEIASWASVWSVMPWEMYAAMEGAVTDGKASFSRSGATGKGISWLSLIVPNDAELMRESLVSLRDSGAPRPLAGFGAGPDYYNTRYDAAIRWIDTMGHAVISNGPFYLEGYWPESRTIRTSAFRDDSYPFAAGSWSGFEDARLPRITGVDLPDVITRGGETMIPVSMEHASHLHYFFTGPLGEQVSSGVADVDSGVVLLVLGADESRHLVEGANNLKLFAISDSVRRPDVYAASFLAVDGRADLPDVFANATQDVPQTGGGDAAAALVIIPLAAAAVLVAAWWRRRAA